MTSSLPLDLHAQLQQQLARHKRRLLGQRLLLCLPLVWLAAGLYYFCNLPWLIVVLVLVFMFCLGMGQLIVSAPWRSTSLDNLLLHYNRLYPQLEESAQLLKQPLQNLNLLQQLQQQKVAQRLATLLNDSTQLAGKTIFYGFVLWLNVLTLATLLGLFALLNTTLFNSAAPLNTLTTQTNEGHNTLSANPAVRAVKVTIEAPAYSQLPAQTSHVLDLSLLAGSEVIWQVQFKPALNAAAQAQANPSYHIQLSSGASLPLLLNNDGWYQASAVITQSVIYTLASDQGTVEGVYTLSVTPDTAPLIRFIKPVQTTSEIARDGRAEIDAEVWISDDFAISQVEIVASIAKGSGEAVKFRDQRFSFDSTSLIDGKSHYLKHWQLSELGMEPGDELYFSVWAWDNREPEPQLSRSANKIVRWLEEEQSELAGEGILLDMLPEYFKSQRQIIIETEQLLADRPRLTDSEFKGISQDLGFAQSDLKQKYGQFVGDEFADASPHSMESAMAIKQAPEHHEEEHEDGHEDELAEHNEDEHEHQTNQNESMDKSGFSQVIEQYGHDHGEAEVGLVNIKGAPSPTALMKRAIANMWDAERHLLQSAPDLALPYEKAALNYLNQAKKAERIYVKRLGFEPTPVSESRRYQGELKELKSVVKQPAAPQLDANFKLLEDSIRQLNQWLSPSHSAGLTLSDQQLSELKSLLMARIDSSAETIKHLATLEKLRLDAGQLKQDCALCIKQLVRQLWQLLPVTVAQPTSMQQDYLLSNPSVTDYQQFLLLEQGQ